MYYYCLFVLPGLGKMISAVREGRVSRHNGAKLWVPLKPLNTIECRDAPRGFRGSCDAQRHAILSRTAIWLSVLFYQPCALFIQLIMLLCYVHIRIWTEIDLKIICLDCRKITAIRCIAVRETGVSRYHGRANNWKASL